MQLVIDNVNNLEEIVIKSADGQTYFFVKSDEFKNTLQELNKLRKRSDNDFVMQSEYMREKNVSHETLKKWVAKGLPTYKVGGNIYYRLSEIAEFKSKHRI